MEFEPQQKLTAAQLAAISAAFDSAIAETDDHQPDLHITIKAGNGEIKTEEKPITG